MDFGVQKSRSQCIDNCKFFMLHNCFQFTPIIMNLHTKTPHELRMCLWALGSKGQGHNALIAVNGLCCIIAFNLHLSSWNFYTKTPHELRMCPMGSRVQRSRSQCIDNWKLFMSHNCFISTPIIMKLHTQAPRELRMCLWMSGSKGQGHNALIIENGFWRITAFPLHLHSSNFIHRFPVSPGYALMILR